ncbi:CaiB/BaiF CoA transferase family protein [Chloroflexota bacterium]
MLSNCRALDLTDEKGFFCGKVLADLGSDVIKIEPPGGDSARRIGPFYHDICHPEKSLFWFAYNTNKRGITLDIETKTGQDIFKKLVKTADFVIESYRPGYMEKLGLGYTQLSKVNPGIIMSSISPFGSDGPYKDYESSDIVNAAMGGVMYLYGDPDRPPVRVSCPQTHFNASIYAATGMLIAYHYRKTSGEGQHVDVSQQESMLPLTFNAIPHWLLNERLVRRSGSMRVGLSGPGIQRQTWPCQDGSIHFTLMGWKAGQKTNTALVEWMDSEGMADEFLKSIDWSTFDMVHATKEWLQEVEDRFGKFFISHTKAGLFDEAINRRVMLYPVYSPEEVTEEVHLKSRDFWNEVEHPELGTTITYPGAFAKCSEYPIHIRQRAPLIGEHNEEVYEELGIFKEQKVALRQAGII